MRNRARQSYCILQQSPLLTSPACQQAKAGPGADMRMSRGAHLEAQSPSSATYAILCCPEAYLQGPRTPLLCFPSQERQRLAM